MIYGVIGTFISTIFISISLSLLSLTKTIFNFNFKESFGIGSLISATDSVAVLSAFKGIQGHDTLYQILFGESIMNDAVGLVFYETVSQFNEKISIFKSILRSFLQFFMVFFLSIIVGFFLGYLTAFFIKKVSKKIENENIYHFEIGCMIILPFVSYLVAEIFNLSGIVALLFNGIAHSTYTKPFLSYNAGIAVKNTYQMVCGLFEILVYVFLGIGFSAFWDYFSELKIIEVILFIIIVIIGRCINIYISSMICNLSRDQNIINDKMQVSNHNLVFYHICR